MQAAAWPPFLTSYHPRALFVLSQGMGVIGQSSAYSLAPSSLPPRTPNYDNGPGQLGQLGGGLGSHSSHHYDENSHFGSNHGHSLGGGTRHSRKGSHTHTPSPLCARMPFAALSSSSDIVLCVRAASNRYLQPWRHWGLLSCRRSVWRAARWQSIRPSEPPLQPE